MPTGTLNDLSNFVLGALEAVYGKDQVELVISRVPGGFSASVVVYLSYGDDLEDADIVSEAIAQDLLEAISRALHGAQQFIANVSGEVRA